MTAPTGVFDPATPSFWLDPWSTYRELRARPAATWGVMDEAWLVTRHDDVRALLHDHATFPSDDQRDVEARVAAGASRSLDHLAILGAEPPAHTRLRKVIGRCFRAPQIAALRPTIESIVDTLLDEGMEGGRIDLMRDLAVPLPLLVTAHLLGMDRAERARLQVWANNEMVALMPAMPREDQQRLLRSSEEMLAYFRGRVADARRDGAGPETVFGQLLAAAEEGGPLSQLELLAFLALLVKAGSHTVTHLIGTGMLALLRHREHLELLREDPSLWPRAMGELARHSGPMHSVLRVVREPVTVHGVDLEPGDRVHAVLAAANRDESRFPEPDALRFDRPPADQLAFGTGIHYCVGAELGKLQATIALQKLLERMPRIARAEPLRDPDWSSVWAIRGLRRLPLRGGRA
jgi:cytochrome P450